MNTIEEILKKKEQEQCKTCANKKNKLDLCHMTINLKNEAQCVNYKCMTRKCHGCRNEKVCFDGSDRYVSKSN